MVEIIHMLQVTAAKLGQPPMTVESLLKRAAMQELEQVAPGLTALVLAAADGDEKATRTLEAMACTNQTDRPACRSRAIRQLARGAA